MDVKIVLSREKKYWKYGPGDKVEGKLIIINPYPVYCSGIQVSLEVLVRVHFRDNSARLLTNVPYENLINPPIFTYVWPINWGWNQLVAKCGSDGSRQVLLPASKFALPFTFSYPTHYPLPGSFCSEYGSIKHQVAAYVLNEQDRPDLLTTHILSYKDYLNLLLDPVALKPLKFEKKKEKSIILSLVHPTMESPIHFTLRLVQRGFIPGEYAKFRLSLVNLTGKSLAKVAVSLVQRVTYHSSSKGTKKVLGSVLDETETLDLDSAVETFWESGVFVPANVKPTFARGSVQHQYFIKIQVFSKRTSSTPTLKGYTPIIIGTTRDLDCGVCSQCGGPSSSSHLRNRLRRTSAADLPSLSGRGGLGFYDEEDDLVSLSSDENNIIGKGSPPPSYSQLASRATSVDSFLPMYEEAIGGGGGGGGSIQKTKINTPSSPISGQGRINKRNSSSSPQQEDEDDEEN